MASMFKEELVRRYQKEDKESPTRNSRNMHSSIQYLCIPLVSSSLFLAAYFLFAFGTVTESITRPSYLSSQGSSRNNEFNWSQLLNGPRVSIWHRICVSEPSLQWNSTKSEAVVSSPWTIPKLWDVAPPGCNVVSTCINPMCTKEKTKETPAARTAILGTEDNSNESRKSVKKTPTQM